jgi:hypothetical protein
MQVVEVVLLNHLLEHRELVELVAVETEQSLTTIRQLVVQTQVVEVAVRPTLVLLDRAALELSLSNTQILAQSL